MQQGLSAATVKQVLELVKRLRDLGAIARWLRIMGGSAHSCPADSERLAVLGLFILV